MLTVCCSEGTCCDADCHLTLMIQRCSYDSGGKPAGRTQVRQLLQCGVEHPRESGVMEGTDMTSWCVGERGDVPGAAIMALCKE